MGQYTLFAKDHQLNCELGFEPTDISQQDKLPGQPRIKLNDSAQLAEFLRKEFHAPDLEEMAPRLWMMSTQSSANISPLHEQKVRGREIIITEDPRLHLTWIHDRVFIKPIPKYLLASWFWTDHLDSTWFRTHHEETHKAALGFLRTYRYLIKHESDFDIALEKHLIPGHVTWIWFVQYISTLDGIGDSNVSLRYSYGELRLSRLNFYAKFFLYKFHFRHIPRQYSEIFAQFYGPLLFMFGTIAIVLNAMQVEIAVEQLQVTSWTSLSGVYRWFSIICVIWAIGVALALVIIFWGMIANEWIFAIRVLRKKRRTRD